MDERGIEYEEDEVIAIIVPSFDTAPTMGHVTTTVTVPVNGNTLTGGFFTDQNVSASVTLRKEFTTNR